MSESVGGFYAKLKLEVEGSTFSNGERVLKKYHRQAIDSEKSAARIVKQQAEEAKKSYTLKHRALEQQAKDAERYKKIMLQDKLDSRATSRAVARGIDMPFSIAREGIGGFFTSLKWLTGGLLAATSALGVFAAGLNKTWGGQQVTAQSARGLSVSSAWLTRWGAAERISKAPEGTVATALGGIERMLANPEIGQQNPELITAISGILGLKTSDPKLAFQALSGMKPEKQAETVFNALDKMFKGDWKSRTQAQSIAGMLAPGLSTMMSYANGGIGGAYAAGAGVTMISDADIRAAEQASIAASIAMEKLRGAWDLFASNMATELTPYLNEFNSWFTKNGPQIRSALKNFSSFLGDVAGWMDNLIKDPMGTIGKTAGTVNNSYDKWREGVNQDAGGKIFDFILKGKNPFYEGPRVMPSSGSPYDQPGMTPYSNPVMVKVFVDSKAIPSTSRSESKRVENNVLSQAIGGGHY